MSKNPKLAYEAKEPAFLQKLRGQYGNNSGRLERPAARPRRLKNPKDDDDDEPVYIDEESNEVISKEEYRVLAGGTTEKEGEASVEDQSTTESKDKAHTQKDFATAKQNNLTEVGGHRKRKQAKVVGEEKPEEQKVPGNGPDEAQPKPPASRKPKKTKKIKLSFDEE